MCSSHNRFFKVVVEHRVLAFLSGSCLGCTLKVNLRVPLFSPLYLTAHVLAMRHYPFSPSLHISPQNSQACQLKCNLCVCSIAFYRPHPPQNKTESLLWLTRACVISSKLSPCQSLDLTSHHPPIQLQWDRYLPSQGQRIGWLSARASPCDLWPMKGMW